MKLEKEEKKKRILQQPKCLHLFSLGIPSALAMSTWHAKLCTQNKNKKQILCKISSNENSHLQFSSSVGVAVDLPGRGSKLRGKMVQPQACCLGQ